MDRVACGTRETSKIPSAPQEAEGWGFEQDMRLKTALWGGRGLKSGTEESYNGIADYLL